MTDMYVIWSIEHDRWWRPARVGYTRVLAEAGRYSQAEARAILKQANIVKVNECMIPLECVDLDARVIGQMALSSVLGAIREQSSLTQEDHRLLDVIDRAGADHDFGRFVQLVHEYYHDLDRANRTPRALLYFHIGSLVSVSLREVRTGE